jgi:uncharacterized protein (TIGR04551 family)
VTGRLLLVVVGAIVCAPAAARADRAGFGELGGDATVSSFAGPRDGVAIDLTGGLRVRGEALYNLDLDRGLTPSGEPLFPVPIADPDDQTFTTADMRLRTDLTIRAPGSGVGVTVRVDVLDNLVLGSTPESGTGRAPTPAASPGQSPPADAFRIKRAYGEALTPFGTLAVGRMGSHWGLGLVANGGDCGDCDGGDAADRIAFATPIAGHIWAAAYDFSATGPTARRRDDARAIDIEPTDDVQSVTLALLRYRTDLARARRSRADRISVEYGAYLSHRWQDNDIPADYLPTAQPQPLDSLQVMARGYRATAVDGWLRLTLPRGRVELEAAVLTASVDQASLVPGVLFEAPVESTQLGAALESEVAVAGAWSIGFDTGYASGDAAPGFGAFPPPNAPAGEPGELDGPQANPPFDNTVDNFRFHPDYRVDRVLFREIIGTVTDAYYLRPHVTVALVDVGRARLTVSVAAIASWAVEPASTPSGSRGLGLEIDPTVRYETTDGFIAVLEHGVLFPLSGLDNPEQGLDARTAQVWRLRLGFDF